MSSDQELHRGAPRAAGQADRVRREEVMHVTT